MDYRKEWSYIATYTEEDVVKRFKPGDKIWACAYEFDCNKESKKYIQKPVYGIFVDGWCGIASANINEIRFFTTINKNGHPSRSKKVHLYAREYADTEEECIKLYNSLVQKKIDYFQQRIEEVKKEFIKEDFVWKQK